MSLDSWNKANPASVLPATRHEANGVDNGEIEPFQLSAILGTPPGLCAYAVWLIHHRKVGLCSTTTMSTTASLKPGNQLWGIYHTDREYARVMGDPLRTVIEAPTKLAAEEAAADSASVNPGHIRSRLK
jgi:hypothetical protein